MTKFGVKSEGGKWSTIKCCTVLMCLLKRGINLHKAHFSRLSSNTTTFHFLLLNPPVFPSLLQAWLDCLKISDVIVNQKSMNRLSILKKKIDSQFLVGYNHRSPVTGRSRVLVVQWFGVGLVIKRSLVRLLAGRYQVN